MAVQVSYPGVYIEELPSGVHTVTGVATSITAFVGRALTGPLDDPITVFSYGDYESTFGGLSYDYPMSYAVQDFFANGGSQAVIVRLFRAKAAPQQADWDSAKRVRPRRLKTRWPTSPLSMSRVSAMPLRASPPVTPQASRRTQWHSSSSQR